MVDPRLNGRKLKVVLFALHFAEYVWELAQALALDHEVLLLIDAAAAKRELGALPTALPAGLTLQPVEVKKSIAGLRSSLRECVGWVEAFQPDVLHFQEVATPLGLLVAWRLRRFPMVLTIHDPTPHSGDDGWSLSQIRQRLTLWLFRRSCDAAISHGQVLSADIVAGRPALVGRVFSVPHGPLGGPAQRQAPETGRFLFFGRIQKYKGLAYFVEAVRALHAQGLPVRGVIAGRGPDLAPLRPLIEGHPAFELHEGFIPESELPALFGAAQAVVLPYTDGTQSGVAAMALGFGRAVVSTRVGAVQEMVREGENGLLVPPRDAAALAAALRRLIETPELAQQMAERSLALGQGDLSWRRNAQISAEAYRRAIELRLGR